MIAGGYIKQGKTYIWHNWAEENDKHNLPILAYLDFPYPKDWLPGILNPHTSALLAPVPSIIMN